MPGRLSRKARQGRQEGPQAQDFRIPVLLDAVLGVLCVLGVRRPVHHAKRAKIAKRARVASWSLALGVLLVPMRLALGVSLVPSAWLAAVQRCRKLGRWRPSVPPARPPTFGSWTSFQIRNVARKVRRYRGPPVLLDAVLGALCVLGVRRAVDHAKRAKIAKRPVGTGVQSFCSSRCSPWRPLRSWRETGRSSRKARQDRQEGSQAKDSRITVLLDAVLGALCVLGVRRPVHHAKRTKIAKRTRRHRISESLFFSMQSLAPFACLA